MQLLGVAQALLPIMMMVTASDPVWLTFSVSAPSQRKRSWPCFCRLSSAWLLCLKRAPDRGWLPSWRLWGGGAGARPFSSSWRGPRKRFLDKQLFILPAGKPELFLQLHSLLHVLLGLFSHVEDGAVSARAQHVLMQAALAPLALRPEP